MLRLIFLSLLVLIPIAAAAQPVPRYSEVRIVVPDRVSLGDLFEAGEIDHANVEATEEGIVVEVVLGEVELERVLEEGFAVEILVEDVVAEIEARAATCPTNMPSGTPQGFFFGSLNCYPTLSETIDALDAMRAQHQNLISQRVSIGQSWEGRDIWMVRITAAVSPTKVPEALYTSLHHAREPGSLGAVLYFMYYLLENYGEDPEVTYLLNNRALYFIPVVNPDGYRYVETHDLMWRKNRRANDGGSFGVDLNRNYAYQWGGTGSSGVPTSQTYRGPYPFSEPEVQAVRTWLQSRSIRGAFNYHTHGRMWLYPYGYASGAYTADHEQFVALSQEITRHNHYVHGTAPNILYVASGISDDWMYAEQTEKPKIFAWTPEMGPAFWPNPSEIVSIAHDGLHPNLVLAHAVGPYLHIEEQEVVEAEPGNGHLDPGEKGLVHAMIFNRGLSTSDWANARIVSTNPKLGVSNGPWSSIFSLSAFGEVSLPPLSFTLGHDAPLGVHDGLMIEVLADGTRTRVPLGPFVVGTPVVVFEDSFENASNWELNDWGLTAYSHTPPYAVTDSPGSNYPNNADNALILQEPLDLSAAEAPRLRFAARWDIQENFDFLQVLASSDGETWTPLEGLHTRPGSGQGVQPAGEPGYDGTTWWVQEEISLASFAGEPEVHLMWRMRSDASQTALGFFLDDVEVLRMVNDNPVSSEPVATGPRFGLEAPYPNPSPGGAHVRFSLGEAGEVSLGVYDLLGRRVVTLADGAHDVGTHDVSWDGRDASGRHVAAGTYVLHLRGSSGTAARRLTVVR